MYFSYCDDFGNHGRVPRVAATTAHVDCPGGPGVRKCGRPRSEFRRRCDTYTNFVQPELFNHSRLLACSNRGKCLHRTIPATSAAPSRRSLMQVANAEPGVAAAMRSASRTVSTSVS